MFFEQGPVIPGRVCRPIDMEDRMVRPGSGVHGSIRLEDADFGFLPWRVEDGLALWCRGILRCP